MSEEMGGIGGGGSAVDVKNSMARPVPGVDEMPAAELYQGLEAGDPKADAEVRKIYQSVRQASLEGRELLERGWWQKLLYCYGRQWIYYSPRGGWQDKRLAKWIPRPVTNMVFDTVSTIRSMLSDIEPGVRVRPNGSTPANVLTAQIADDLEPVIYEEHDMQQAFFEADFWAPALGTVFLHPYWNRDDPRNRVFVQALACPVCQFMCHPLDVRDGTVTACPQDGTSAEAFVPAQYQTGQPIGEMQNVGAGCTDVVSPLEILFPSYCQRWCDVDRLIRLRWRPKSYYEGRPYEKNIRYSSTTAEKSLQMFRSLSLMTDMTTAPFQWGGSTPTRVEGAIEAELWIKPCSEYPEGLWCRAVGGLNGETYLIRDDDRGIRPGPLPYEAPRQDNEAHGRKLWPWIYYPYEIVGGRIWGKSSLDPIITKQDALNRNDSMVELIMARMANPIWLEPKGSEVQRFTGEPGLIVRYQVIAGTQAEPKRIDGVQPTQAHFALRTQYLDDIEKLGKTRDVLKGSHPAGVEAFSALNLLVEQSQSGFKALFKQRGRAYRDWFEVALDLERSYGPDQRTRTVMGQQGKWNYDTFLRADMQGAITVIVEDGSQTPKTSLGRRAAAQQAQQMGALDMNDPATKVRVNDLLGVHDLAPGLDAHTKAAATEHEQYEQWVANGRLDPATGQPAVTPQAPVNPQTGQPMGPPPPTPGNPLRVEAWQNHAIHIEQLDIWANADRIRALTLNDPLAKSEITYHRTQHVIAQTNQFALPIPAPLPQPPPDKPKIAISMPLTVMDLENPRVQQLFKDANVTLDPSVGLPNGPGSSAPQSMPLRHAPLPEPHAIPTNGKPHVPQGAALAMTNSNRESGAVDTLPGHAPGGGNMSQPL
jgi:hypothetical protein